MVGDMSITNRSSLVVVSSHPIWCREFHDNNVALTGPEILRVAFGRDFLVFRHLHDHLVLEPRLEVSDLLRVPFLDRADVLLALHLQIVLLLAEHLRDVIVGNYVLAARKSVARSISIPGIHLHRHRRPPEIHLHPLHYLQLHQVLHLVRHKISAGVT